MEVSSPRCQGDDLLLQILNDRDTGTLKLGPGSPSGSVRRLQRALFDLTWTLRIDPPLEDESAFAIGLYGPVATRTVTAYKDALRDPLSTRRSDRLHRRLRRPATLRKLDRQCVLHDASAAAIEAKAVALRADGTDVVLDDVPPATRPALGTPGFLRTATVAGEIGLLLHTVALGAFEVHGPIAEAYVVRGHAGGRLGFPMSDVFKEDPFAMQSDFEHGLICWMPDTEEVQVLLGTEVTSLGGAGHGAGTRGPSARHRDMLGEPWPATR